jgi:succinate-semialdehyde dehydrogenase/glutarate-semialdehyde dehydrogenase
VKSTSEPLPGSEASSWATDLYIAGQWREGKDGRRSPVLNPATEEQLGTYAVAEPEDVAAAAEAARRAMPHVAAMGALGRSQVLRRAADWLRAHRERIAVILTTEQGKPLREARIEVEGGAELLEWFAEEARRTYGRIIPGRQPGVRQLVMREPVGPVAAFAPWNFPISQLARKVGPALAAGCPLVVKPAEETPHSAACFVQAFAAAGAPDGALNLVFGDPARISNDLLQHPAIRKISFTGSVPVGKKLAAQAGAMMKRATMELGGHAPVIVTAQANLERAVAELGRAKFRNAGQVCVSPTRFLVEDAVYDRFLREIVAYAAALRVGNGRQEGTDMGPLANERRRQAVEALIADAIACGGRIAHGGSRLGTRGYFLAPTIIDGATPDMRAMNEEPFGPVALMMRVSSLDAAIAEANRLPYGLAAYAYCGAEEEDRIASGVETGMLTINHLGLALPETPFGGIKDSGYGSEGGTEALDGYLTPRFVSMAARVPA